MPGSGEELRLAMGVCPRVEILIPKPLNPKPVNRHQLEL